MRYLEEIMRDPFEGKVSLHIICDDELKFRGKVTREDGSVIISSGTHIKIQKVLDKLEEKAREIIES